MTIPANPPTPPAPLPPAAPQRVLIIRPSALGDVCRSVPVLASLKRAWPTARIDWLVQDGFAPAIEHHPALGRAVPFPRDRFSALLKRGRPGEFIRWLRRLRAARYDLVLDCQGLARSGLFARLTGAPRRVGFADAREMGWLGLSERCPVPADLHSVDRMLALVRCAGAEPVADMRLYSDLAERAWVTSHQTLGAGGYAVIAPTSRWPGKRWPAERFAEAARALLDLGVASVAVIGAASERGQCGPVLTLARAEPRVVDLVGGTSIGRVMAVIEASRLVIANDSAALHMAVGFERPIVGLYGPTRVDRVGPYGRASEVIQHVGPRERLDHKDANAGLALMERIGVEEVVAAAGARLGESRGAAARQSGK